MKGQIASTAVILGMLLGCQIPANYYDQRHSIKEGYYQPPNGFVPDKATAVRIAEAVLTPIYGEEHIKSERPFHAVLSGDTWNVSGTLPQGWDGGTAVISIDRRDGRISNVTHYK